MKIKTISDEAWSGLCVKPFIAIGFHAHQSKVIAVAADNDGICALRIIADDRAARRNFFSEVNTRHKGSPIAISSGKTGRFLENFLAEKKGERTTLQIVLKGPENKLSDWESEVESAIRNRKTVTFSPDNPIQCLDL